MVLELRSLGMSELSAEWFRNTTWDAVTRPRLAVRGTFSPARGLASCRCRPLSSNVRHAALRRAQSFARTREPPDPSPVCVCPSVRDAHEAERLRSLVHRGAGLLPTDLPAGPDVCRRRRQ